MKRRCVFLAPLLALFVFVSGCDEAARRDMTVVTTFYPLYIATINVTRDVPGVAVSCLAPPEAGCLHDYQMTAADRRALEKASVVVMNGAGLETFLDGVLPGLSATVADASEGVALLEGVHGKNPHVWVSPDGMMQQTMNIAAKLSEWDPGHAEQYDANARAYVDRLAALRNAMQEALKDYYGVSIVTFHEAFAYFAEAFGLHVAANVVHDEGAAPSAQELAWVADVIKIENIRALFAEPQYTDASVETLSRETGLPVYTLDPVVSGKADPNDYDAYLRIMEKNLETLLEALQ